MRFKNFDDAYEAFRGEVLFAFMYKEPVERVAQSLINAEMFRRIAWWYAKTRSERQSLISLQHTSQEVDGNLTAMGFNTLIPRDNDTMLVIDCQYSLSHATWEKSLVHESYEILKNIIINWAVYNGWFALPNAVPFCVVFSGELPSKEQYEILESNYRAWLDWYADSGEMDVKGFTGWPLKAWSNTNG